MTMVKCMHACNDQKLKLEMDNFRNNLRLSVHWLEFLRLIFNLELLRCGVYTIYGNIESVFVTLYFEQTPKTLLIFVYPSII